MQVRDGIDHGAVKVKDDGANTGKRCRRGCHDQAEKEGTRASWLRMADMTEA